MPITDKEIEKFRQEWAANAARQRLEESMRRLRAGEFTVELVRAEDDPKEGEPAFQRELRRFTQTLQQTGVSFSQRAIAMDAVDACGFPLPEFVIAIKTLGPPVINAVAICTIAWLQARNGRRIRIRIGDFEAEAPNLEEVEALLQRAPEYHERISAGGKKGSSDGAKTNEID